MFPNPGQSFSNGCSQPGYDTSTHCIHSFDRMSIQLKSNRRNLRQANSHYKVKCVNETRDDTSSHPDGSAMPPTHNGPSLFPIRPPPVYAPESFILALLIYACLPPWRRSRACACAVAPSSDRTCLLIKKSRSLFSLLSSFLCLQARNQYVVFRLSRTSIP